jgi:electron transport complex protein RnfG
MITALTVVGIIAGASLVFVYDYAMPKIKKNIFADSEKAISNIFPEAARTEEKNGVMKVLDSKNNLLGYAFTAEGNGYQGTIKLMAGIDEKIAAMKGVEVLESQETPGLGAEINGARFKVQFAGLSIKEDIEYVKNQKPQKPNQVEAIAGATISSRAVVNILNNKIEDIKKQWAAPGRG